MPHLHDDTHWQLEPSFLFDALCFLNVLTGDEFYVRYYREEYGAFAPRITPAAGDALALLARTVKEEGGGIISAFLTLCFSATDARTLMDARAAIVRSDAMRARLQATPYYSDEGWEMFRAIGAPLDVLLRFLEEVGFEEYWHARALPRIRESIAAIERELPAYNVVCEVERHLGVPLSSNTITILLLYFSRPHGIRITGTRFITDAAYPLAIVLRNAVHEMLHPPYDLLQDVALSTAVEELRGDRFLMDAVLNHDPAYGYNSFHGYLEEDCVQAIEQIINERFGIGLDPHERWRTADGGMHVLAAVLYDAMREEGFGNDDESFRDLLIRLIATGRLRAGAIHDRYAAFLAKELDTKE
ncbi:MAG TPA: hypothetical protein VHI13_19915 [Candidatus Kapabacteria bacterium]|nr:hypothetical protein [Candidatus Kapabacteria bacterium]